MVIERISGRELTRRPKLDLHSPRIQHALAYVDEFTAKTVRTQPAYIPEIGAIGLGDRRFRIPNTERFPLLFYWDSYFMMQGNLNTPNDIDIAKSTIAALCKELDDHHIIPNASLESFLISSQAPLLSSMIMETYQAIPDKDTPAEKEWLQTAIEEAKKEYSLVWTNRSDGEEGIGRYHHYVDEYGLSRYGDRDTGYGWNAERESGWDFTSRFAGRAEEYLPIDLNCFLYKYEMDFAKAAEITGNVEEAKYWNQEAEKRKQRINELMWDDEKGFFFDFNYVEKERDDFYSLAAFATAWSGLATPEQLKRMLAHLPKFDKGHGLIVDAQESLQPPVENKSFEEIGVMRRNLKAVQKMLKPKQWDAPYVFPPIEFMAIKGILDASANETLPKEDRLLFLNTAIKIMEDSIETLTNIFEIDKNFPEKYNGVTGTTDTITEENSVNGQNFFHYKKQGGFGWTCSTYKQKISYLHAAYFLRDELEHSASQQGMLQYLHESSISNASSIA